MSKRKINFISLLKDYIETYLPYSRGLSVNTINSYKQCFLILVRFMHEEKHIVANDIKFSDMDYDTLLEFFNWLETSRGCKSTTRNQRLSALSAFSEYAQNRDFDAAYTFRNAVIKIPVKKAVQKQRAVFTREEIKILLDLPDEKYETGLRDKLMLSLMYATGARAQEICDLKVRNMRMDTASAIITLNGKGSKVRQVAISKKLGQFIQKYSAHRNIENYLERHIFSSQTHEQMTVSCVEGIYKKYVRIAKKKYLTLFRADSYPPHSMRHSTACHLLEAGVDIVTIKNILGHVSVQTTQIYAEMSQDTVDKKLKEWNETWFGNKPEIKISESKENIPDFLRK